MSQKNYVLLEKWVESEVIENSITYQSLTSLYKNFQKYITQHHLPTIPKRLFLTSLEKFLKMRGIFIERKRTSQETRIYGIQLKKYDIVEETQIKKETLSL